MQFEKTFLTIFLCKSSSIGKVVNPLWLDLFCLMEYNYKDYVSYRLHSKGLIKASPFWGLEKKDFRSLQRRQKKTCFKKHNREKPCGRRIKLMC